MRNFNLFFLISLMACLFGHAADNDEATRTELEKIAENIGSEIEDCILANNANNNEFQYHLGVIDLSKTRAVWYLCRNLALATAATYFFPEKICWWASCGTASVLFFAGSILWRSQWKANLLHGLPQIETEKMFYQELSKYLKWAKDQNAAIDNLKFQLQKEIEDKTQFGNLLQAVKDKILKERGFMVSQWDAFLSLLKAVQKYNYNDLQSEHDLLNICGYKKSIPLFDADKLVENAASCYGPNPS